MALPVDPESIKKEFLQYIRDNPEITLADLMGESKLPMFYGYPVKLNWLSEAEQIRKNARRVEKEDGTYRVKWMKPPVSVSRPEPIVKIANVEPRQQGKTLGRMLKKFADGFTGMTDLTRELTETTQAQSDAQNAISKHIQNRNEQEFKKLYLGTFKTEKTMADVYPIRVESISLDHKGGTKSYHITKVTNQDGKSLVIYRWGKTGAFGDVMTEMFDSPSAADKAFEKKLSTKMKGGYSPDPQHDPKQVEVHDFAELRNKLGRPTLAKLGPDHIKHIDKDVDTAGIREAQAPRLDEDGRVNTQTEAEKRKRLDEEKRKAREELERKQQQEYEAAYTANPNFGAF